MSYIFKKNIRTETAIVEDKKSGLLVEYIPPPKKGPPPKPRRKQLPKVKTPIGEIRI